ncbi:MAG: M12 family metallo-peptidase [Phycisphaerae bacterium]
MRQTTVILMVVLTLPALSFGADRPGGGLFAVDSVDDGVVIVRWDRAVGANASGSRLRLLERGFPLRPGLAVDLDLRRFSVTSLGTRFVLGRRDGSDEPFDFDGSRISLFRGQVAGRPGSHVFLALSDDLCTGRIDVGSGAGTFLISSKDGRGAELGAGRVSVFEARGGGGPGPGVPSCGLDGFEQVLGAANGVGRARGSGAVPRGVGPFRIMKQLELAVETDYEFFILFGDPNAAAAYLVAMYGQVSDIYMRDVGTRVELVFARIWETPDDLFNNVDPTPLFDFRNYWNANMQFVQRDAAQLLSGRRDYPFGGQAFVSALCGFSAYSVVGYAMGSFPDPTRPSPYHYDIAVTAHELGHISGTTHTHDFPNLIDTCNDPNSTPQRGTIMSYCGQTWSGQNANRDLYFHTTIVQNILNHINSVACVVDDCNLNSVADAADIASGVSLDANADGIPDECEDCNGNGILDDAEIAAGAPDVNGNGIPDSCESDCNGNGIPDDQDIANGTSLDAYGNGVPDECEPDCNGNGTSDFTEIQANMSLDVDRNAVLDACQDCDADGTTDFVALAGAHDLWIASGLAGEPIREFYATSGVLTQTSTGGGAALVNEGQDLIIAPDGRVLVTSGADHRVMQFDQAGIYLGDFVPSGAGGLSFPTGLAFSPQGTLLVCSRNTNNVLAYDGTSGTPLGAFVAAGAGGLTAPFGLTFGPNGNLFVTSGTSEVLEFDGQTGSFVRVFVGAATNGGLVEPKGLTFKRDGNLLVASFGTNEVLEFHAGSGTPLGKWAQVGTATRLTQISPWGVRVGPNGNVFVVRTGDAFGTPGLGGNNHHDDADDMVFGGAELHLTNAQIYEFDIRNGNFVRTHIGGNDHGLLFPTGFAFVGRWDLDCNLNLLPDSCDIASGLSADANADGVPDECQIDCNGNGVQDRLDIIPFGTSRDCNGNGVPDACDPESRDVTLFVGLLLAAHPDPTLTCMHDRNDDGRVDGADIQSFVDILLGP